jgi:hypothetical protein
MEAQSATSLAKLRHVVTDAPRVMVVDGSKLVRKLIGDVLQRQLPGARVIACEGLESARALSSPSQAMTRAPGSWRCSTSPINLRTSFEPSTTITRGASVTTCRSLARLVADCASMA